MCEYQRSGLAATSLTESLFHKSLRVAVMETLGGFPNLPALVRAEQSSTLPTRLAAAGRIRVVARRWNTSSIPPPRSSRLRLLARPGLGPDL
jgi:hypothetical protein